MIVRSRSIGSMVVGGLAALLILTGCGGGQHEPPKEHHSVLELIDHHQEPNPNGGVSSLPWLEGVEWMPVHGVELGDVDTFFVATRTDHMVRFPCSECHSVPLASMRSPDTTRVRAHWELELNHASEGIMNCQTCHADDRMDSLATLESEPVSFNQAYRVCGQCHSTQLKEWVWGAHGKRIGGWAPPRVAMNCTSCHNPHDPGFKARFPARASRVGE